MQQQRTCAYCVVYGDTKIRYVRYIRIRVVEMVHVNTRWSSRVDRMNDEMDGSAHGSLEAETPQLFIAIEFRVCVSRLTLVVESLTFWIEPCCRSPAAFWIIQSRETTRTDLHYEIAS